MDTDMGLGGWQHGGTEMLQENGDRDEWTGL